MNGFRALKHVGAPGLDAPSVDEVDVSEYKGAVGDPIVIRAHDDFDPSTVLRADVTGVSPSVALRASVALTQADGGAIESGAAVALRPGSGQATPANSGRWVYAATAAVPTGTTVRPSTGLRAGIAVTAQDGSAGSPQAGRAARRRPFGSAQGKRRRRRRFRIMKGGRGDPVA